MAPLLQLLLLTLPFETLSLGDLACNFENSFTVGAGDWLQDASCNFQNTNSQSGAMIWIGEQIPDSRNWTDYTVEVRIDPTTGDGGANGGIAFNIMQNGHGGDSGNYYALSLFPSHGQTRINVNLGKWTGRYNQMDGYHMYNDTWTEGQYFDMKVNVAYTVDNGVDKVTIHSYLDGALLGVYEDIDDPYVEGSVGLRNYQMPANYKKFYVHFPGEDASSSSGSGGWIFIGILFGVLFLYCVIGYIINGVKSKEWSNYQRNVPQLTFWKVLPQLTFVGCQVSYEVIKGLVSKKVGDGNDSLMETAEAGNYECDAEDQNL